MKIFRMCLQQWAALLLIGLAVTGYPHHAQAMSLFMGVEEPKQSAPPSKPVVAKTQPPLGQPGQGGMAPASVSTPTPAVAQPPLLAEVLNGYTYDPKSRRDPFQSLTHLVKIDKTRLEMPPLQRVPLSDLKLLGIMWGGYGYYGLVRTPDGKGYTVKEGMLMGTNSGVIATITDKAVIVSEPSMDITGNKSTKAVEILLRPKEAS
jgi:type IV pilus assembly protein PilP